MHMERLNFLDPHDQFVSWRNCDDKMSAGPDRDNSSPKSVEVALASFLRKCFWQLNQRKYINHMHMFFSHTEMCNGSIELGHHIIELLIELMIPRRNFFRLRA